MSCLVLSGSAPSAKTSRLNAWKENLFRDWKPAEDRRREVIEAEKRLEGGHRSTAPIEAVGELVQVGLEMAMADAVVGATKPRLQIAEDAVDAGEDLDRAHAQAIDYFPGLPESKLPRFVQAHQYKSLSLYGVPIIQVRRNTHQSVRCCFLMERLSA